LDKVIGCKKVFKTANSVLKRKGSLNAISIVTEEVENETESKQITSKDEEMEERKKYVMD